ncbi:phosphoribosyl transferase domain protein [Stachybotrys elegans]|uniref:Phosphoribosyl transferase domain protein n=1 Tax=Stachybotrys elegans TaxID=80388 RepID=A0A8K0WRD3_9HYPO|nr:phosphoribosyl transferase domain protein [Stachybotrys elegans]
MNSLETLKRSLRDAVAESSSQRKRLTDAPYSSGFDTFLQGPGAAVYQDFIVPQLAELLDPLVQSRLRVSVLEIGPGPATVLSQLPDYLKRKINRYTAYEPNVIFAVRLDTRIHTNSMVESQLPYLSGPATIHQRPFELIENADVPSNQDDADEKYDVVLFCHSMYGLKPNRAYIEKALQMLSDEGLVIVFHRDGCLDLGGMLCHRTKLYHDGFVKIPNDAERIDSFARFIAGFTIEDDSEDEITRMEWRKLCRSLGLTNPTDAQHLYFNSPEVMIAFNRHANALSKLTEKVPLAPADRKIKDRLAGLRQRPPIVRPPSVPDVQICIKWAIDNRLGLTVMGGGHSDQCVWPNVVAVDMEAFDTLEILPSEEGSLIVVGAGCKAGDIISRTMAEGLTVPLGSRPSVGAGMWLQGGIGHLSRMYGFACDAIVGAVLVSVATGEVLYVGSVPSQHIPPGAVRPSNESDLLWALKGAGTNVGIVLSVTFKAFEALSYFSVKEWMIPLEDGVGLFGDMAEGLNLLKSIDRVASDLPRYVSSDVYVYSDNGNLHLGVSTIECCPAGTVTNSRALVDDLLGQPSKSTFVNAVGLFDTEMYVSSMHGGHGGGKTSSFKRCVFLKIVGKNTIGTALLEAVNATPTPLCYLHRLHGGGAISDVDERATAFGCRNWDFACVITGVWSRQEDNTDVPSSVVKWVYKVANDLLLLGAEAYGADLGPDPRDTALAAVAFGPNRPRLARLKHVFDPYNVLAHACPIPTVSGAPRLIILVTGESCAGKDFCANIWADKLTEKGFRVKVSSISEATKREYAAKHWCDLHRLLHDREYKEERRGALTSFFQEQVNSRPELPKEHFTDVVGHAGDVDVLLVTGMRDEAPVTVFSQIFPESKMVDVHVVASEETRVLRGAGEAQTSPVVMDYCPSFIFKNEGVGTGAVRLFADTHLMPLMHEDLTRLTSMVRPVLNFPRQGVEFRHILNIAQHRGGLSLCSKLLQTHFHGDWAAIDALVSCEAGGFVFASALATLLDKPLALVREAGKLPPPTVSVDKPRSHISSTDPGSTGERAIEIEQNVVPKGASVVVVDDVLATGATLYAVLQLLEKLEVKPEKITVMVVAEFAQHGGREFLRRHGFGGVHIQSLLAFGGA